MLILILPSRNEIVKLSVSQYFRNLIRIRILWRKTVRKRMFHLSLNNDIKFQGSYLNGTLNSKKERGGLGVKGSRNNGGQFLIFWFFDSSSLGNWSLTGVQVSSSFYCARLLFIQTKLWQWKCFKKLFRRRHFYDPNWLKILIYSIWL